MTWNRFGIMSSPKINYKHLQKRFAVEFEKSEMCIDLAKVFYTTASCTTNRGPSESKAEQRASSRGQYQRQQILNLQSCNGVLFL